MTTEYFRRNGKIIKRKDGVESEPLARKSKKNLIDRPLNRSKLSAMWDVAIDQPQRGPDRALLERQFASALDKPISFTAKKPRVKRTGKSLLEAQFNKLMNSKTISHRGS